MDGRPIIRAIPSSALSSEKPQTPIVLLKGERHFILHVLIMSIASQTAALAAHWLAQPTQRTVTFRSLHLPSRSSSCPVEGVQIRWLPVRADFSKAPRGC